jgi:hypothetical protein
MDPHGAFSRANYSPFYTQLNVCGAAAQESFLHNSTYDKPLIRRKIQML